MFADQSPQVYAAVGVDVLTAQEDGTTRLDDDKLLDRALELGRVLFTQDDDLLNETALLRQRRGLPFAGVIYAHQQNITVRADYRRHRTDCQGK
jgi:predicted nuclease of predicted toxin-antitoxin system